MDDLLKRPLLEAFCSHPHYTIEWSTWRHKRGLRQWYNTYCNNIAFNLLNGDVKVEQRHRNKKILTLLDCSCDDMRRTPYDRYIGNRSRDTSDIEAVQLVLSLWITRALMRAIVFATCRIVFFNTKPIAIGAFNLATEAYCCQIRASLDAHGMSGGVEEKEIGSLASPRARLTFCNDVHDIHSLLWQGWQASISVLDSNTMVRIYVS